MISEKEKRASLTAKKIPVTTLVSQGLADIHTPVGIYLRLRDRYRDTILLESTDSHAAENSYSFICVNAIAGIEIGEGGQVEYKYPTVPAESFTMSKDEDPGDIIWKFMQRFDTSSDEPSKAKAAQGLYGYTSYDILPLIEKLQLKKDEQLIPIARYRLYQYVVAINHFRDEMLILENRVAGIESDSEQLRTLIQSKDVPVYPFATSEQEHSNITDAEYLDMVQHGIAHCHRGDVFQIVLSRRFSQEFTGDDFNVYRALRHINPSPYLFYFDYGEYKLMGSSPEAQVVIRDNKAVVNPIAGTFRRTGHDETDQKKAAELLEDPKENAEHVMLVDLARNDLSRVSDKVEVQHFRQIQFYSHVIHMVSQVSGVLEKGSNPFDVIFQTFPAGTLSGAPKFKAMQLIDEYEKNRRSFYGGTIGFAGFDGSCNHAIIIRSFLSKLNTLIYQAGAGIVAASRPEDELNEISNKLEALKKAISLATKLS